MIVAPVLKGTEITIAMLADLELQQDYLVNADEELRHLAKRMKLSKNNNNNKFNQQLLG